MLATAVESRDTRIVPVSRPNQVKEARVCPGPETRGELLDALNQRRSMRAVYHAPVPAAVADEVARQVRAWGRVENWAAVRAASEGAQ